MILTPRQPLDASQLAALARLFSSGVFREVARKGESPLFSRLVKESGLATEATYLAKPIRNLFDAAFSLLKKKHYRHEYAYKAAITHKVLLGAHKLHTASMLTEFRVGGCKADVVILNGTSTVYEIKSERDRLDRLQDQISAYRKVFAKVNVITGENHVKEVLASVPSDVGILILTDRYQISPVREPTEDTGRVVSEAIFDSLQRDESRRIMESLGVSVPEVPNTQLHQAMRERFSKLEPHQAHAGMVRVLRETRSLLPLSELIDSLPDSLRPVALSTPLRKQDHQRLAGAMNTPLVDALKWA